MEDFFIVTEYSYTLVLLLKYKIWTSPTSENKSWVVTKKKPCSEGYFHLTNSALSFALSNIIDMQPDAASFFGFH